MTQKSISLRAWAELLLLGGIWGASFLSNAIILREIGFLSVVAFRVTGAALILWAYVWLRGLVVPRDLRLWAAFAVSGAMNTALPFALITWGQTHIASGLASILNCSTAIFGVLVAALVFADERLTRRKLAGIGLGFAGAVTVIGPDAIRGLDLTAWAQLALIGAAMCYAFGSAFNRARLSGLTPQVAAAGMLTASSCIILPVAIWVEGLPSMAYAGVTWTAMAYLSVIATAAAYLLYYRVLGMAGAGSVLLVTLLVAPVAILLGALFLDETLPLRAYAGFALLAGGLVVIDGRILNRRRAAGAAVPPA
jgi:drug/metabolite transporter (DMT)-like permease